MNVPQWDEWPVVTPAALCAGVPGGLVAALRCRACGQPHRSMEPHAYDYACDVDEDLACGICLQPLVLPTDTPCGHTFCKACLLSYLRVQPLCPIDRTPVQVEQCSPASIMVRRLLDKLSVKCPNVTVCQQTLPRSELEDHLNHRCLGAALPCPQAHNGCMFRAPRKVLLKHQVECYFLKTNGYPRTPVTEGEITRIEILRTSPGLGMSVVGGYDSPLRCIIIQEVHSDGLIAQDGRLQPGDQIVEVNGEDLANCTHLQAVTLLRNASTTVLQLSVYRDRVDQTALFKSDAILISLWKNPGKALGLRLKNKRTVEGVYVAEMVDGNLASQDGRLQVNDRILEINSVDVRRVHSDEATGMLQTTNGAINLLVSRSLPSNLPSPTQSITPRSSPPPLPPPNKSSPLIPLSLNVMNSDPAGATGGEVTPMEIEKPIPSPIRYAKKTRSSDTKPLLQPKYFTIIKAVNETLGIRIAGGLASQQGSTPVYVQNIAPNGCLARSKQLKKGDVLLSVNGMSLLGVSHAEAVAALKAAATVTSICMGVVEGRETSSGIEPFVPSWIYWHKLPRCLHMVRTVTLHRSPTESLGFSLVGGYDSCYGTQAFHVLLVVPDSIAAKEGKLKCGDQIVSVNGHRLDSLRHSEAVALLKQTRSRVLLEILSWPGTAV